MQVNLPYGNTHIVFDADDHAAVLNSRVQELTALEDGQSIVRRAMQQPINSLPLKELARGKRTCTVIISDHTRPVPSQDILPPMLEELREGNPDIDITLLVATGFHRLTTRDELVKKLGKEIANREKIVVHDCQENNVSIGTLPSGAPLVIDRLAVKTDLLVAEGFIEPHFFAGFSGGRKSVLPGVCDRTTVLGNHCSKFIDSPFARTGILDGNPLHQDMLAAAYMAKLAYVVNVIIDEQKHTVAAYAGDYEAAHRQGCDFLKKYCVVRAKPSDIVVTTNGGVPLDQNIYQCVKGLTAAETAARPGGVLIMCAECLDGTGGDSFYKTLRDCESPATLYEKIMQTPQLDTIPDQWESQILARILKNHPVIFVTRKELETTVREMKMIYAETLGQAMKMAGAMAGENPTVTLIPNGIAVIVDPNRD